MPKSLSTGPSAIVPIKAPEQLKKLLEKSLVKGETISQLTRDLWVAEIMRRAAAKPPKRGKRKEIQT